MNEIDDLQGRAMTLREIDALVAEKVMGWARDSRLTFGNDLGIANAYYLWPAQAVYRHKSEHDTYWERWSPDGAETIINDFVPHYSSDIVAAKLVLDRFEHIELTRDYGRWTCEACCLKGEPAGTVTPGYAEHEEMAMAVCLAALTYKGIEVAR